MIARIDTTTIARIIDPKPFERDPHAARYGDMGRRLQAMRKAERILAFMKRCGRVQGAT